MSVKFTLKSFPAGVFVTGCSCIKNDFCSKWWFIHDCIHISKTHVLDNSKLIITKCIVSSTANVHIICKKGHLPLLQLGPMYRCAHAKHVPSTMSRCLKRLVNLFVAQTSNNYMRLFHWSIVNCPIVNAGQVYG